MTNDKLCIFLSFPNLYPISFKFRSIAFMLNITCCVSKLKYKHNVVPFFFFRQVIIF